MTQISKEDDTMPVEDTFEDGDSTQCNIEDVAFHPSPTAVTRDDHKIVEETKTVPSEVPKNPWKKTVSFASNTNPETKSALADIMNQQEVAKNLPDQMLGEDLMQQTKISIETEEERMIRLAIEASLKDLAILETEDESLTSDSDSLPPLCKVTDDDSMDDDMKLAIKLSLTETNMGGNTTGFPDLIDTKMPASEYDPLVDSKPSSKLNNAEISSSTAIGPSPVPFEISLQNSQYTSLEDTFEHCKTIDSRKEVLLSTTTAAASPSASISPKIGTKHESSSSPSPFLTDEEHKAIARAILEADDQVEAQSLKLAMELQAEENRQHEKNKVDQVRQNSANSNVRTITRSEFDAHKSDLAPLSSSSLYERQLFSANDYDEHNHHYGLEIKHQEHEEDNNALAGYQINASTPSKTWSRIGDTILGPNDEVRTKHDVALKSRSNAERLLSGKNYNTNLSVGDNAFNSFNKSLKQSMKRRVIKGVERSGIGRAENMNEKTRGGAMDGNVRLLITKAINNGLIQHCNGVVKEGKEAIVYHAETAVEVKFDVAVKVFKRMQEFKGRGSYLDGDPRYHGQRFKNADKREKIELWTEKEYRNLIRASRGGVAVPTPLLQTGNVLFMRFLGDNGWPAPQLRELEIKKGSRKWTTLYCQTCVAIRRLYHCARLVHADCSEYNIIVCPMSQVENAMDKRKEARNDLQIVLIDFGQAVERNHHDAMKYLRRDLSLVRAFFTKQNINTLSNEECEQFIVREHCGEDTEKLAEVKFEVEVGETLSTNDFSANISAENEKEWRHNIKGWDDDKDCRWLENRLIDA